MSDSEANRRLVLAVLPHLGQADRLLEQLQQEGHALAGTLLIGGDAAQPSPERLLLSEPRERPIWTLRGPVGDAIDDAGLASLRAAARARITTVSHELSSVWDELHTQLLDEHKVLGLLPGNADRALDVRLGRTLLQHARDFVGLFDLLGGAAGR